MQVGDQRAGLWAAMRQRWLDVSAQPADDHRCEDAGPSLPSNDAGCPPVPVQAWDR